MSEKFNVMIDDDIHTIVGSTLNDIHLRKYELLENMVRYACSKNTNVIFREIEHHLNNEWIECQLRINASTNNDDRQFWLLQKQFIENHASFLESHFCITYTIFNKRIPKFKDMNHKLQKIYMELFGNPYLCDTCIHRKYPPITTILTGGENVECEKRDWVFRQTECNDYGKKIIGD